jgi:hypothetical protein
LLLATPPPALARTSGCLCKDKKNDRAPDYRMYLSETPQSSGKSKESSATETQDAVEEDEELDVL